MIILDAEEQQRYKQLHDTFSGTPTLRYPEKAVARSDSPLPDYETSEARQKLITQELSSHKGVDPKLWRAILYAFIIYVILSIIIGVPIIVVKKREHDVPVDLGPHWDNDPDAGTSISIYNSGVWDLGDTAKCNWDSTVSHSPLLFTAHVQRTLNYSGSFYIRSNISNASSNTSQLAGHLVVDINPDPSASNVVFNVNVQASSKELLRHTLACFIDSGSNRGLFIFVTRQLADVDDVKVNIEVLLPKKGTLALLENFTTCLPQFSHNFGDLKSHVTIKNIAIEGAGYDIVAGSIKAAKISIKNSYASIIGDFHVTTALTLDGIKGNLKTNITLEQLSTSSSPTSLVLDNGDGSINANVTLLAPLSRRSGPHPPPYTFIANVKTYNGPLRFKASNANYTYLTPLHLTVQNTDGETDVYLDNNFEGNYNIQSKLGKLAVRKPYLPSSMDPLGQRRQRLYHSQQHTSSQMMGWVGWGKQPTKYDVIQGQVKITTSLSSITLHLGSASEM